MTISDFVKVEWAPASNPTSTSPTWVDITSIVMEVEVSGGRSGVFDLYGPRTATIRCRNGTKSPAVSPTFDIQGFYRWRQIRVKTASGTAFFTGFVLSVEHDQTNSPFHGEAILQCADAMVLLSRAEFDPADYTSDTYVSLADAVELAVTLAGLDASLAAVSSPSTATYLLAEGQSGNVLTWLQSVMEGEGAGGVQVNGAGLVVANGRWSLFDIFGAFLTFTDTPSGPFEFAYLREHLTFAATDTDYYNRAVTSSVGSPRTWTVENVPTGYPSETISRTDLPFQYESWAEANAHLYVDLYSVPVTYPRSLSLYLASQATQQLFLVGTLPTVFGNDHVLVKHTPAGDTQQTYNVTIESVQHTITPELWKVELGFASYDRWFTAYGDGSAPYALVQIGGDSSNGIGSDAIIAP